MASPGKNSYDTKAKTKPRLVGRGLAAQDGHDFVVAVFPAAAFVHNLDLQTPPNAIYYSISKHVNEFTEEEVIQHE